MSRMKSQVVPAEMVPREERMEGIEILDPATSQIVDRILAGIDDLHSAPQVVQDVLSQTRRLDFDMQILTSTLASDPALSAKILRLVNSASFGLPRKIESLPQAVMLLGQRTLRLVVMTFSLVDRLAKGAGSRLYAEFWRQSLTMATVAARLSHTRSDVAQDEAYAAGLVADLGILALAQSDSERYLNLFLATPHDRPLIEGERQLFQCDHAQVGSRLLERWGFSPACCLAARRHHEPGPDADGLSLVVAAAQQVATVLWHPRSEAIGPTRSLLRADFGYDTDKFIALAVACKDEVTEQAELYGVTLDRDIDVDAILEEARRQFVAASLETALDFDSALAIIGD